MERRFGSGDLSCAKRGAIPWGAIGALTILFGIESIVNRHWLELTDPTSLSWRFSAESAECEAPAAQVLCLGDSLLKHGLVPSILARDSGLRTLNLSAAQGSTVLTQSLLRRSLNSGARPKALIVNAKPAVLLGGPEVNARAWQEVLNPYDLIELLRMTRNPAFVASLIVGRVIPSLRSHLEIRSAISGALRGETSQVAVINPVLWRNWAKNAGANVASAASPFDGAVTSEVRQQLFTDLFYVDPANAQAIEKILEIAAERRIPIFWVLFPISPKLQSLRDQSGADAQHDRFLKSIAVRHPGQLTVLDARHAGYPAHFFVDATHLNRRGALVLSRSVAAALSRVGEFRQSTPSSNGDWIVLDASVEKAAEGPYGIEDVEESKRVVWSDPSARVSSR
jgi:hypothetical protein